MMKRLLISVVPVLLSALTAAAEDVGVSLLHFRRSYRVPAMEGMTRMVVGLALTPPRGFVVCEQAELKGTLRAVDAGGTSLKCTPTGLSAMEGKNGAAQTELKVSPHPKGDWMHLQGTINVTLAEKIEILPQQVVSLTEPSTFTTGGIRFSAAPVAQNAARSNIEDSHLRTAELHLECPAGVVVLHVARIWTDPDIENTPAHRQELPVKKLSNDGQTQRLSLTLWDALPAERLEIVTCKSTTEQQVPVSMYINLGGVMPTAPTPAS